MNKELRRLACNVLMDDEGITHDAWETLSGMLKEDGGHDDILNQVSGSDGRFYLPEDTTIPENWPDDSPESRGSVFKTETMLSLYQELHSASIDVEQLVSSNMPHWNEDDQKIWMRFARAILAIDNTALADEEVPLS